MGPLLATTITNIHKNHASMLFRITLIFRNSALPKNDKCLENSSSSRKDGSGSKEPRPFLSIFLLALALNLMLVINATAIRLPAPNRNGFNAFFAKIIFLVEQMNGKPNSSN